jgi:hypothetical protein
VGPMPQDDLDPMRESLKRVATTLKGASLDFALCGGWAIWARGGPEPSHDVDFLVAEGDVERCVAVLTDAGLKVERPPEDWLFKVFDGDVMIDILHRIGGDPASQVELASAETLEVLSVRMPVMTATEVIRSKLAALRVHYCDFAPLLSVTRAVREQLDWGRLETELADNDFAASFLFLAHRLSIAQHAEGEQCLWPDEVLARAGRRPAAPL